MTLSSCPVTKELLDLSHCLESSLIYAVPHTSESSNTSKNCSQSSGIITGALIVVARPTDVRLCNILPSHAIRNLKEEPFTAGGGCPPF